MAHRACVSSGTPGQRPVTFLRAGLQQSSSQRRGGYQPPVRYNPTASNQVGRIRNAFRPDCRGGSHLPRSTSPQQVTRAGEFVRSPTWCHSTEHASPSKKRAANSRPYDGIPTNNNLPNCPAGRSAHGKKIPLREQGEKAIWIPDYTSSMTAISAASPRRSPVRVTLV